MTSNNASPKRPTGGVKGLDEYSQFMDLSPELVAFKRFGRLSIRNLLALQAQLQALQCEIDEVDSEEERTLESGTINEKMKLLQVNVDWRSFERAAKTPGNDRARRKMEKTLQLGKLLDQYYRAMGAHSTMMQHPPPKTFVYNFSRDWFLQHRPMIGPGNEHYSDREQLASLMKPGESDDLLSRAMQHLFGSCFKERKPVPDSWRNVRLSSDSSLRTLTTIISVLLATILLFGATAVLTLVTDLSRTERMAMIGCFTATFAVLVGIFTNCKRSELFVAVATYSAVLVVFAEVTKDG